MASHTPTPWTARPIVGNLSDPQAGWIFFGNNNGRYVGSIAVRFEEQEKIETAQADADFLVRAVNCHEELIKLLEWSLEELSPDDFKDRGGEEFSLYERIQAAVAKATGE